MTAAIMNQLSGPTVSRALRWCRLWAAQGLQALGAQTEALVRKLANNKTIMNKIARNSIRRYVSPHRYLNSDALDLPMHLGVWCPWTWPPGFSSSP